MWSNRDEETLSQTEAPIRLQHCGGSR